MSTAGVHESTARRYRILGPLQVLDGDVEIDPGPAKHRALLVLLLLRAGHVVPTDVAIDLLWSGEPPRSGLTTLHGYVAGLRRSLGPGAIRTRSPGYLVEVGPGELDADVFAAEHAAGRAALAAGDWATAARVLRGALDLWRGPALADIATQPSARGDAVRLEQARLAALDGWAQAELARGRHRELVPDLEHAVREAPFREDLRVRLATALYRSGRQVDALATIAAGRTLVVEELGIDPTPELAELEGRILRHDPELAGPEHQPARETVVVSAPKIQPVARSVPGRDRLLGHLLDDVTSAINSNGRVVLLAGEPGIGKTRLAEEIADAAAAAGAAAVWGRCDESPGAPAFWPWMELLGGLGAAYGEDALRTAIGPDATTLALVAPALEALTGATAAPPSPDPQAARFLTCAATASVLVRLARQRPLAVVLDDVQWADPGSLQLLVALARVVAGEPIVLVVTLRSTEPGRSDSLVESLAALSRAPGRRHDLTGIDDDAVAGLLAAGGVEPDASTVAAMQRRTRGNPFFVNEVLRWMGGAGGDDRDRVPASVGDVVRDRVRRLGPATSDVLEAAAVLNQHLEVELLAEATALSTDKVLDCLAPAVAAGLLVADGRVGRWRFAHGLVREAVEADLDLGRRTELHLRAARAFEAIHGGDGGIGPHLAELAHHRVAAIPAGSRLDAIAALRRAADWSAAHLAHQEAAAVLREALGVAADLPAGVVRDLEEVELQAQLARLYLITEGYASVGLLTSANRVRELCLRIDPYHPLLLPTLWALCALHTVRMDLDLAIGLARELLELGEQSENLSTLLLGHLAVGTVQTHIGAVAEARPHLDTALELCRAGHDAPYVHVVAETPMVWALAFSAWNWWACGDADLAEEHVLEAVRRGREIKDGGYQHSFATWFAGLVATLRQDVAVALQRCDEGLALAAASGFGMFVPFMRANRGWAIAVGGDADAGIAEITAASAAVSASGARMLAHTFACFLSSAQLRAGRTAEANALAIEGLRQVGETGERWLEAELYRLLALTLAESDPPAALAAARRSLEVAVDQGAQTLVDRARGTLADLGSSTAPG